jgi:L-lactate dehydrogenase (cytochrome)
VPGGRDIAEATMARAKAAGYTVLVVTIDTPVSGMRERDFRYGVRPILQKDLWGSLPYAWQFVTRPRWVLDYFADGRPSVFPNVELPGKGAMPCGDVGMILESTIVTWDDFRWMRDAWKGPIVVKGVHTGDDAKRAIDAGAQGVVVSNHGGRQLDGVPATLRALPEVLDAVSGRIDVMLDGGIRRGGDVVKAIALGAKAVLVGRAYAWALGAAGGPGVARAIDILRTDIVRTLRLLGCPSIRDLDRSYISADTRHNSR